MISMRDFIFWGVLGPVRLGMSRQQVEAALGPPHVTNLAVRAARHPEIWCYAGVQLWFEEQPNVLERIGADYFPDISYVDTSGTDWSLIDHWILRGDLALEEAEAALREVGLSYTKSEEDVEDGVTLLFESGVRLDFSREWSDTLLLCGCSIRR